MCLSFDNCNTTDSSRIIRPTFLPNELWRRRSIHEHAHWRGPVCEWNTQIVYGIILMNCSHQRSWCEHSLRTIYVHKYTIRDDQQWLWCFLNRVFSFYCLDIDSQTVDVFLPCQCPWTIWFSMSKIFQNRIEIISRCLHLCAGFRLTCATNTTLVTVAFQHIVTFSSRNDVEYAKVASLRVSITISCFQPLPLPKVPNFHSFLVARMNGNCYLLHAQQTWTIVRIVDISDIDLNELANYCLEHIYRRLRCRL